MSLLRIYNALNDFKHNRMSSWVDGGKSHDFVLPMDASMDRVEGLLRWFESSTPPEFEGLSFEAFVAFANAIGCATTWTPGHTVPVLPLLTEDLPPALLIARLVDVIGTDKDTAMAAFRARFQSEDTSP
jgi:hypothetical protein